MHPLAVNPGRPSDRVAVGSVTCVALLSPARDPRHREQRHRGCGVYFHLDLHCQRHCQDAGPHGRKPRRNGSLGVIDQLGDPATFRVTLRTEPRDVNDLVLSWHNGNGPGSCRPRRGYFVYALRTSSKSTSHWASTCKRTIMGLSPIDCPWPRAMNARDVHIAQV